MKKATTAAKVAASNKHKPVIGSNKHIVEKTKAPVKVNESESAQGTSSKQVKPLTESTTPIASIEMDFKQIVNELAMLGENKPTFNDKWPLVMDENERLSTFLRHRDVCSVNCLEKDSLDAEKLRMKIIGALRYNKPLVIDFMDNMSLLDIFKQACDKIDSNLYKHIMDTSIRKEEIYMKLVKDEDGDEYSKYQFNVNGMFKTIFIISKTDLPESFRNNFVPYLVKY